MRSCFPSLWADEQWNLSISRVVFYRPVCVALLFGTLSLVWFDAPVPARVTFDAEMHLLFLIAGVCNRCCAVLWDCRISRSCGASGMNALCTTKASQWHLDVFTGHVRLAFAILYEAGGWAVVSVKKKNGKLSYDPYDIIVPLNVV